MLTIPHATMPPHETEDSPLPFCEHQSSHPKTDIKKNVMFHFPMSISCFPALATQLYKSQVNIEHAGDAAVAIPVLFLGPQLIFGLWQAGRRISLPDCAQDAASVSVLADTK